MQPFAIKRAPIELMKFLKLSRLVESGGQAKLVIEDEMVKVNGELETRKRRFLDVGDTVEFQGTVLQVAQLEQ